MKTYADRHDDSRRKRRKNSSLNRFRDELAELDDDQLQFMVDAPNDYVNDIFNQFDLGQESALQSAHLITEDELSEAEGLMGKSEFLELAEVSVRSQLQASFEGTGFSEKDCPWLKHLFRHYGRRSAKYLEHSIHKYLPGTKQAESVEEYIAPLGEKVQRAIGAWLKTGQITEVPAEIPRSLMRVAGQDAANQRARMGKGKDLDSGTKSKMEGAFGTSIGDVKVHTESEASAFADELDAQAATIGKDIAFGADKYKPGTPEGDALIAHELAHVMQQQGATETGEMGSGADYAAMEQDAEGATRGVLGRLWGGMKSSFADLKANAWPRLKSGLQMQRCNDDEPEYSEDDSLVDQDSITDKDSITDQDKVKDEFTLWQEEQLEDIETVKSMGAEQWKTGIMRSKWNDVSGIYVDRQKFVGDRADFIDKKISSIENQIKAKEDAKKKKSADIAKLDEDILKLKTQLTLTQTEKDDDRWGKAKSRWEAFMTKTESDPFTIEKPDDVSTLATAEKEDIEYLLDNEVYDAYWVKTSMIKFINFLYYGYYFLQESEFTGEEVLPGTPNFPSGPHKKGDPIMSYIRSREILSEEMNADTGQFYRFDTIFVQADVKTLLDKVNELYGVNVTPADLKAQLAQESGDFENIDVAGTSTKTKGITTGGPNPDYIGVGQIGKEAKIEGLKWISANSTVTVNEPNGVDARTVPKEAVKLSIGYDAHMIELIKKAIDAGDGVTVSPMDLKKIGFAYYNGVSVIDVVKAHAKSNPKKSITYDDIKEKIPGQSSDYVDMIFSERRE